MSAYFFDAISKLQIEINFSQQFKVSFKAWQQNLDNTHNRYNQLIDIERSQNRKQLSPPLKNLYLDLNVAFSSYIGLMRKKQSKQNSTTQIRQSQQINNPEQALSSQSSQRSSKTYSQSEMLQSFISSIQRKSCISIEKTIRQKQNYVNLFQENQFQQKGRSSAQVSSGFQRKFNKNYTVHDNNRVIGQQIQRIQFLQKQNQLLKFSIKNKVSIPLDQRYFFNKLSQSNKLQSLKYLFHQLSQGKKQQCLKYLFNQQQQSKKQQYLKYLKELFRRIKQDLRIQNIIIIIGVQRQRKKQYIQIDIQSVQLDLKGADVHYESFKSILKLRKKLGNYPIQSLNLASTAVTCVQVKQLVKHLQNLKYLNLFDCKQLTQFQITNCKHIKKLILSQSAITDIKISQLLNLEQLVLKSCQYLSTLKIINYNKQLKKIYLNQSAIASVQLGQLSKLIGSTIVM